MAREYWYFLAGVLVVLIPLLALVAVKKLDLLEARPDGKVTYSQIGDQALSLHVFRAQRVAEDAHTPAVLLFHGGGWLYGTPADMYPQCLFFAAQGISCFAAEYRLGSGGWPDIPAAVADARAAFDYLLDHAEALRIDRDNIAVGGGSAGGQMAAALGVGLPLPNRPRPAALVLYNPILDMAPGQPYHYLVKDSWREVSPYQQIDGDTSPALVMLGSRDPEVPVATVQAWCDAMRSAGGRCDMEVYEGQSHGFFNNPRFLDATNQRALAFLSSLNPRSP